MITVDYLIVGSGLTGATIGRILADGGREVLILERRAHLGGNVHDFTHSSKIRVHTYGPHYFRCSSDKIWDFVNRFATFVPFSATIRSHVHGHLEEWPINRKLFDRYPRWEEKRPASPPANFEEACLQKMPRPVYKAFVRGYTRRQWGLDPRQLDAQLASRIRINGYGEVSLSPRHRFQGLPAPGYAAFMEALVAGIPQLLNVDYLQCRSQYRARKAVVFTGPIDEYFGFADGHLAYRGQRRTHEFMPDRDQYQPCVQVNYPAAESNEPIRSIEWKHLMPAQARRHCQGTFVTHEFPFTPQNPDQFEYPLPVAEQRRLYKRYFLRAAQVPGLMICGRLGEYRYLDMDHAIGRAFLLADKLYPRRADSIIASRPVRGQARGLAGA